MLPTPNSYWDIFLYLLDAFGTISTDFKHLLQFSPIQWFCWRKGLPSSSHHHPEGLKTSLVVRHTDVNWVLFFTTIQHILHGLKWLFCLCSMLAMWGRQSQSSEIFQVLFSFQEHGMIIFSCLPCSWVWPCNLWPKTCETFVTFKKNHLLGINCLLAAMFLYFLSSVVTHLGAMAT